LFTVFLGFNEREVKRLKIKNLWENGVKQRKIAKEVGCDLATVARWVHRFKKTMAAKVPDSIAVRDKMRSGARPKITKFIGKEIVRFTNGKQNRQLSVIRDYIRRRFGITLTCMGIWKWLKNHGLRAFHMSRQPRLVEKHRKKRVKFATMHQNHDWDNTLFTDETEFLLYPATVNFKNDVVWAKERDAVPPVEVQSYSEKVRVWGGVSTKGNTTLVFYEGELNAVKYLALLMKAKPEFDIIFGPGTHRLLITLLTDNRNWTFVHDGASPHKASGINQWLDSNVPGLQVRLKTCFRLL
jgi:transposase